MNVLCLDDWLARGISYLNTQHIDEAIDAFSMEIEMNPEHVEAYNNRGIAWCKKGALDRAIADYNKALEIDPRCAEAYNNRGVVWFYKEKYDKAIDDYDKALGIDPNFAKAYSNRGAAWFSKGNPELAVADYNRALKIEPDCPEIKKQLAWIRSIDSGNARGSNLKGLEWSQEDIRSQSEAVPQDVVPVATQTRNSYLLEKPHNKKVADEGPHHDLSGMANTSSKMAFSVQVGAFRSREKAERLTALLKDKGYAARILPLKGWGEKILYTVRIGDYATLEEAKDKAAAFSENEGLPSIVRPENEL